MQLSDESLAAFLIESGTLPRKALEEALISEGESSLGERLVTGDYMTRDELRRAHAHLLGVPFVELEPHLLQEEVLYLIPEPLARGRSLVAFARHDNEVEVALLDLDDLEALAFLTTEHGLKVLPRLTTGESIKRALIHYQKKLKRDFGVLARGGAQAAEALLRHALLSRASSVHLDFKVAGLFVRYRIRGLLEDAMTLPREAVELFARLKEMAGLSKTLHVPQEGGFKVDMNHGEEVRVRAHSTPTHAGERLVLHLTPRGHAKRGFTLESLGLHGETLEEVHKLLQIRSGLVLVVGPAMSGKSTLLYTLLDALQATHKHLVTIEEEIDVVLPYATQMRVRPEVGMNAAATLRAALRQDPDVCLVGSVRDRECAELVLSAASRGIVVLAGVEAEGAEDAIERFAAQEISRTTLENTLKGVIATRLVGKVCHTCKESYKLARAEGAVFEGRADFGKVLAALKDEGLIHADTQWKELSFARAGAGCEACERGYKGVVGLQEVERHGEAPLNLIEDGLYKAALGITSIEEVFRLVGGEE